MKVLKRLGYMADHFKALVRKAFSSLSDALAWLHSRTFSCMNKKRKKTESQKMDEEPLLVPWHSPKCFYADIKPTYAEIKPATSEDFLNLSEISLTNSTSSPKTSTSSASSSLSDNSTAMTSSIGSYGSQISKTPTSKISTGSIISASTNSSTSNGTRTSKISTSSGYSSSNRSMIFDENGQKLPYKRRTKYCCRRSEYATIHQRYPDKIALVVEKFRSERRLPDLPRCQFVVPKNTTVGQLQHIIRQKMSDNRNMPVYILIGNKELPSLTTPMSSLQERYHDDDGFVYISYSSEDSFG